MQILGGEWKKVGGRGGDKGRSPSLFSRYDGSIDSIKYSLVYELFKQFAREILAGLILENKDMRAV